MKKAYIFLAYGFEEIEALATVDILRRADIETTTVSITPSLLVKGAHEVEVTADTTIDKIEISPNDWLVLPGGMPGATNLAACDTLSEILKKHDEQKGHIAAICASPAVVLAPLGILEGKEATCYPGFESALKNSQVAYRPVTIDGNVITANGPGNTIPFALAIVANATCEEKAREIAEGLLVYPPQQDFNF